MASSSKVWSIFSVAAALAAAALARKGATATWRLATGKKPPQNPADPQVNAREAVLWAMVSGTLVALARMLVQRRAASYFLRTTGHLPPGVGQDDPQQASTTT